MALTLFMHPLASYCHKALMALYETELPFRGQLVDLGKEADRALLLKLNPVGKFPVLKDDAAGQVLAESSILIEYLARKFPAAASLLPADPLQALAVRAKDRFYDNYVHEHMQRIVADKLRPAGKKDAFGVEQAKDALLKAYAIIDREMADQTWAAGETVTMADCAAAPALFYAHKVCPIPGTLLNTVAYHERLMRRPSYARVLAEAEPYFHMFPG